MPDENTVSVEAGSTTVLGHLTQFVGFAGDTFNAGGLSVPIAAVVSTSELTLAYGWPGADVVDSAAWVLMPTSAEWSSTVSLHKAIVEANAWRNGKFPFPFNNGGPIAKRSLFDGEPMGFTFLELTGNQDDPFRLYGKMSDDSGDWSAGQTLRGDAAISTGEAIAAAALAQAWATQAADEVEPGEGYSAKYHAAAAEVSAVAANTSAGQAAGSATAAGGSAGAAAGSATASGNSAGAAAGSATDAATARDLAQQWATKTDGEVVAGQGRGAKYYSEQAATILAKSVRVDAAQTFTGAEQTRGQTNLGGGATGRSIFAAATTSDAQDAIGATATGKALLVAADQAAGRSAIGAQAALGYTPANKAGDTFGGDVGVTGNITATGAGYFGSGGAQAPGNFTAYGAGTGGMSFVSKPYGASGSFYGRLYAQDVVGSHVEAVIEATTGTAGANFTFRHTGSFYASGSINGASKNFLIDHPLAPLARNLCHASIEAPELMVQYRGMATLTDGQATVDIDAACGMSPGTFAALTTDAVVQSLMPQDSFERVRCSDVSAGAFAITSEDAGSSARVAWLVTARRNDPWVRYTDTTDVDGRLIVEEQKREAV